MKRIFLLFFSLVLIDASAQITVKVVDAQTGEPIPYANIQCANGQSLITNGEGFFTLSEANSGNAIVISYIGYSPMQIAASSLQSSQTVKLQAATYELDEVKALKMPSPETVMAEVRKNLKKNYAPSGSTFHTKLFIRESNVFDAKKLEVEVEKSTGFSKSALKAFNAELAKFTSRAVANPTKTYTDILFDYYRSSTQNKTKIDVTKATKLLDKNRSSTLEGMQENATALFLKHLDTTKYYRIKSGWFGSHDTVSLRKDYKGKKQKQPKSELASLRSSLTSVLTESSLLSTEYQFIHEPKYYKYKSEGSVLLPDGNFAYVITFTPDRGKALYKGKLYVSEGDFAVIRADYQLVEGKKTGGVNLKLLLGVKFSENLKTGTLIFKQRPNDEGYYLQYASNESGQYLYVNRPLKFIELTNEEKDVVAFNFKVEGNMYQKTEYLNMARNDISEADFEAAKEEEFKYTAVSQYDPAMWKNDGGLEPVEEMKRFKAGDDDYSLR